jgi:tRNA threonylcarbamoyladenosine biosynthesis protein TsaE
MPEISIPSTDQLAHAASKFLAYSGDKRKFAFFGDMGAGKTTIIKAICHSLGVTDVVNSPSFTIINQYRSDNHEMIYHMDFFRVKKPEEVYDMGYEEYFFNDHFCFIEWPGIIEEILPDHFTRVYLTVLSDGGRKLFF